MTSFPNSVWERTAPKLLLRGFDQTGKAKNVVDDALSGKIEEAFLQKVTKDTKKVDAVFDAVIHVHRK